MSVIDFAKHANGLPRNLTDEGALELVRELVEQGGRVAYTAHAEVRMLERDVSFQQVLNVLRRGELQESVRWDSGRECYQLKLRALTAGDEVTVRCCIEVECLMGQVVTVITVWA